MQEDGRKDRKPKRCSSGKRSDKPHKRRLSNGKTNKQANKKTKKENNVRDMVTLRIDSEK